MIEALILIAIYFAVMGLVTALGISLLLLCDIIFKTHIGRKVARLFID